MKKSVLRTLAIVLVGALLLTLAGCGAKGKVKSVISRFQNACNALDVNAVLDCIDPTIADIAKGAGGLLGLLSGQDTDAVFQSLSSLLIAHEDAKGVDFFKTLKIKVNSVETGETAATAKVTITYKNLSGEEVSREGNLTLKLSDGSWYITGVKPV